MSGKNTMAKDKLNILFFLDSIGEPISELSIEHGMMENDLMEYFSFKQYMMELENSSFIQKHIILEKPYYSVTEHGKNSLEYFSSKMMGSEKKLIKKYIEEHFDELTKYQDIYTNFKKIGDSRYQVDIEILENKSSLLSLSVEVPSKKMCLDIIDNWNNNPSKMYIHLMNLMISNKTEEK